MEAVRLALLAAAAALAIGGTGTAALATLGMAAALVALRARRHGAAGLAAGIAAGLSPAGLVLVPVVLGTAIARRATMMVAGGLVPAGIATASAAGWSPAATTAPAWRLASMLAQGGPDLRGLLLAAAAGIAAWLGACCAGRPALPGETDRAAVLAGLALPLLAPCGLESSGLALALLLTGTRPTFMPIGPGANDNPLPLRPAPPRSVHPSF